MNRAIDTRLLVTINALGVTLQGTYHLPHDWIFASSTRKNTAKRTGVLFLTGLATPRTAHGDAAVYWANLFAGAGYPAFRVDQPRSGDSGGNTLNEPAPFIHSGGDGPIIAETVRELVQRHDLEGFVLVGHCSGAISAIFAAAKCKECQGLVLLAPPFHIAQAMKLKVRRALMNWAARNQVGRALSAVYLQCRHLRPFLKRSTLPSNANVGMIRLWVDLASAGMPILVLRPPGPKASGSKSVTADFDYLAYISRMAGGKGRLEVKTVEGADHNFSSRIGRNGVGREVEKWLSKYFPHRIAADAVLDLRSDAPLSNELVVAASQAVFACVNPAVEG